MPSDAAGGRGTPESVARGEHSSIAASNLAANPKPFIFKRRKKFLSTDFKIIILTLESERTYFGKIPETNRNIPLF
jgi:hypothetical protein